MREENHQPHGIFALAMVLVTCSVMVAVPQLVGLAQGETSTDILETARAQIHVDGSGDWLRARFPKDLEPIALAPGGGGTVVVLYSKKADISIPLCTKFDVILGAKAGHVVEGWECDHLRCKE